jgi:hypothetical protein
MGAAAKTFSRGKGVLSGQLKESVEEEEFREGDSVASISRGKLILINDFWPQKSRESLC